MTIESFWNQILYLISKCLRDFNDEFLRDELYEE